jgi:cyclohexadienyl dehydratase
VGCGSAPRLRIGTSGDYPPFSVAEPHGAISGFEAVVAHRFVRDVGREMQFVPMSWPRLAEQMVSGSVDVAMSGVTIRADRLMYMLFSRPYAVTGAVVAVSRKRADELGSLEQIDRPGIRLAVNRGGHLERIARRQFRRCEIVLVENNRMLPDYVLRGEVDGAVSDDLEVSSWAQDTFAVVGPFSRDRKAYAVSMGQVDLLEQLNRWLAAREDDGWLNEQRRRWLGKAAVWTPEQACFEAVAASIDLRMQLMPWVASAKRSRGLPIEDPEQETHVVDQVAQWAAEEGLEADGMIAVFQRLIVAAKAVQRDETGSTTEAPPLLDLDALRHAIAIQSRTLVREAARCQPSLARADSRSLLEHVLRGGSSSSVPIVPAGQLASLLAQLRLVDPSGEASPRGYVEFCIRADRRLDAEGYSAQELLYGDTSISSAEERQIGGRAHRLRPGATRIRLPAGKHEFLIYVDDSSGDPNRIGGPTVKPTRVAVDVPADEVVTVRYQPILRTTGAFELRYHDVYGAAYGALQRYSGTTRFDVETEIYEPTDADAASRCPISEGER